MTKTSASLHAFLPSTKHYDQFSDPSIVRKFSRNWLCIAVLLLFGSLSAGLRAQTNPNEIAGFELQRQQERERLLRETQERVPDVRVPADIQDNNGRLPESEEPCFPIREIVLKSDVSTLGGAGDRINIVPKAATLNQGEWKDMERFLKKEIDAGKTVSMTIDVGYPPNGGTRPNQFTVLATINGVVTPYRFTQ